MVFFNNIILTRYVVAHNLSRQLFFYLSVLLTPQNVTPKLINTTHHLQVSPSYSLLLAFFFFFGSLSSIGQK
ncbi:hypothetical protein QBC44DRAFT_331526 [Cladorrhinum sp. PSN332]|nr:hypothetical protein QBC44DRAFT_331526 [Cladorrhinum sp. PSN332]